MPVLPLCRRWWHAEALLIDAILAPGTLTVASLPRLGEIAEAAAPPGP